MISQNFSFIILFSLLNSVYSQYQIAKFSNIESYIDENQNGYLLTPIIEDDGEANVLFKLKFPEPFPYNHTVCHNFLLSFQDITLKEGTTQSVNEWIFEEEQQIISWKIRVQDLNLVYSCDMLENPEQIQYYCTFRVQIPLLLEFETLYIHESGVQILIYKQNKEQRQIEFQHFYLSKNIIKDSNTNINIEFNFCTDFNCDNYIPSEEFEVYRKNDFFVQVKILNPEFQKCYLSLYDKIYDDVNHYFYITSQELFMGQGLIKLRLQSYLALENRQMIIPLNITNQVEIQYGDQQHQYITLYEFDPKQINIKRRITFLKHPSSSDDCFRPDDRITGNMNICETIECKSYKQSENLDFEINKSIFIEITFIQEQQPEIKIRQVNVLINNKEQTKVKIIQGSSRFIIEIIPQTLVKNGQLYIRCILINSVSNFMNLYENVRQISIVEQKKQDQNSAYYQLEFSQALLFLILIILL